MSNNLTPSGFEEAMMKTLRDSGNLEYVMMSDVLDDVSKSLLIELSTNAYNIFSDDNGIFFKKDDGDVISCPSYDDDLPTSADWLSNLLPNVPFDIEQDGNLRRSDEATAAYITACIVMVIDDDVFRDDFMDVVNNYDYAGMSTIDNFSSFSELLVNFQNLQSYQINVIISAAKLKISSLKKDTTSYLEDGIGPEEAAELRALTLSIGNINRDFSNGPLSPTKVKSLTKLQILELLDDKEKQIDNVIQSSKADVLYKLTTLSTEYVSPITKKKLDMMAKQKISELYADHPNLDELVGNESTVLSKWRRRYLKLAKISVRRAAIVRYLEEGIEFKMPRKL